jgi:oligoendopeptidase F
MDTQFTTTTPLPQREEVELTARWALEHLYATDEQWETEFQAIEALLPDLEQLRGTLGQNAQALVLALQLRDSVSERLKRLSGYAFMRWHENLAHPVFQALADRAATLEARFQATTAFFVPEILALDEDRLVAFMTEADELAIYRFYIENLRRQRAHMQSSEVEALLAQAQDVLRTPQTIFEGLSYADMTFCSIRDDDESELALTHERYRVLLTHPSRRVRQDAFDAYHAAFAALRTTFSATLAGTVRGAVFQAQARGYTSTLQMALAPADVPLTVYQTLIDTVHQHLPLFRRYLQLRKQRLGLDQLWMYDVFVPLAPSAAPKITYDAAREHILAGLAPLGQATGTLLQRGLYQERWVDVYETQHKHGGAYCWGVVGSHPFILLNWQHDLTSLMTLAHELGHALHYHYTTQAQPAIYADLPPFALEVPSTCNELLVSTHLLQTFEDRALKLHILDTQLQLVFATLGAQTMFAEFELELHRQAEAGTALTADLCDTLYGTLLQRYGGPDLVVDERTAMDWMTIPHFHQPFYVYQYAIGLVAALALARQISEEGQPAMERYLSFLSSGSSCPPIELLRCAGVDMTTPRPIERAMQVFGEWLDAFEALLA